MKITITGKQLEITDAIREHVRQKIEKLPRYNDSVSHVDAIIEGGGVNGAVFNVEVIVKVEHGQPLVASESGSDTYTCIDMAVHKIERQLTKTKEKQRNHKHIPPSGKNQ